MKKKIVIASVLKPADDVRAYWKMSQSMAKTNKYVVNIIGNDSKIPSCHENINFVTHQITRVQWIKRGFIQVKLVIQILNLKPEVLIITTHELLFAGLLSKWLAGCKLIYDVQENYKANFYYLQKNFLKKWYGRWVRAKENLTKSVIDQYWLAEKCYASELPFTKNKHVIIENKAYRLNEKRIKPEVFSLLYSGTVSTYGGIHHAINCYKKIIDSGIPARFIIIGQVHNKRLYKNLEAYARLLPGIELKISRMPVPHDRITKEIVRATLGFIGYEPNPANELKIPTKLYEYSRYGLPYLVAKDSFWHEKGTELGGAVPVDFHALSISNIMDALKKEEALFPKRYPEEATWEKESQKLIASLNTIIKKV